MKKIKHVVQLYSHLTDCRCQIESCEDNTCGDAIEEEKFSASINHYIVKHGYKLLHIGINTWDCDDEGFWYGTTAILGGESVQSYKKWQLFEELENTKISDSSSS